MLNALWSLASFIVAISILITVHEFGHFWVARRCGVAVERFSLGFGKVLLRCTDKKGTEYVLSLIPLGGYVKMLDERVASVPKELHHQAFNRKKVWQRAAIVGAGPMANFLFAVLAYWIVFMLGVPSIKPVVKEIQPNSIAAQAHLSAGMQIKSVNGVDTPDWDSVRLALVGLIGHDFAEIGVASLGSELEVNKQLNLKQWKFDLEKQDPAISLGLVPYTAGVEPRVSEVQAQSAAQKAGLLVGDKLIDINNKPVNDWMVFAQEVRDNPSKSVQLTIERSGKFLPLTLIPDTKQTKDGITMGFAGVTPTAVPVPDEYRVMRQYEPFTALYEATGETWGVIKLTVSVLGKLITGDVKLNALSGPISIAQGAGVSAEYGVVSFLKFLALISVNLGIINLFPLPVLDGGHLLFLLIEKIKGTPVSEQVQEYGYRIGAMMLMLLMGLALFNDFSRF